MSDSLCLLHRLTQAGVDFVIVAGYAGVVHGCTYVTQDIGICCVFAPDNLLALQAALSPLHPVHRMTPSRKPLELTTETAATSNLYLDTDLGRLDCLSFIDGLGEFSEVARLSEGIEVDGMALRILTLDALIKAKTTLDRPRDREAIRQLEAIRQIKRDNRKS